MISGQRYVDVKLCLKSNLKKVFPQECLQLFIKTRVFQNTFRKASMVLSVATETGE